MMKFIDTHTHLYAEEFLPDLPEVVARAQQSGVEQFILPAIDRAWFEPMMQTVAQFPQNCFPCIGLHPTSVKVNWKEELDFVEQQLSTPEKFAAIGEIGIDGYWSKEFMAEQRTVFETQLRWAAQHDLPVIIHARDSFNEIFEVLDKVKSLPLRGIFHAYSGSIETYTRIQHYGDFKVGIGGVVTFKNAGLVNVLKNIDLSRIVLETDAPWLTPAPYRGKRNESSYIPLIAQKVAEIKETSIKEVADITTKNATALLNL